MKQPLIMLLAVCFVAFCVQPVASAVIRVDGESGNDGNDGSSWSLAKLHVQAAIDAASSGDEVWVRGKDGIGTFNGVYSERITLREGVSIYGGLAYGDTALPSRGLRPPSRPEDYPNETTLDGGSGGSVVTAPSGITSATVIDGFTIRHGSATNGGGIYCSSSSPTVTHNRIEFNSASLAGGGLYTSSGSPLIKWNVIQHNAGNGVYSGSYSNAVVSANIIRGNYTGSGGGVYCCTSMTIENNFISGNSGTGIYVGDASPTIVYNTLTGNGRAGGAMYLFYSSSSVTNNIVAFNEAGIALSGYGSPYLRNNCVHQNTVFQYSGLSAGQGDISSDPKLVGCYYGELHIPTDSPCKDAGYLVPPSIDIDGDTRAQGAGVDIGADEYTSGGPSSDPPTVVRVDGVNGDDDNDGSTWQLAKQRIQAGLDAAAERGGEVWVKGGFAYEERITLRAHVDAYGGFGGQETNRLDRDWLANETTIDGISAGSTVQVRAGYMVSCLDGFTITGGSAQDGGGIFCYRGSARIANNTVDGNAATRSGAGIFCSYGRSEITNNVIESNTCSGTTMGGGGIRCSSSNDTITNNIIASNTSSSYGGGVSLACNSYSAPKLTNNTIVSNSCGNGAGIYISNGPPYITNNVVAGNGTGYGIHFSGTGTPSLSCNDVWNNGSGGYYGIGPGTGDISSDPLFAGSGDYHLQSGSPCRDAGSNSAPGLPTTDFDGQPRIMPTGGTADIGVDEYDATPPSTPVVTDDGAYTASTTQLHAAWTASTDPESGVIEYQYSIGTAAYPTTGYDSVATWTSTGTDTSVTATGLTLSEGQAYYFAVKAKNGQGDWSDVGVSDGITVAYTATTVSQALARTAGEPVNLESRVVSTNTGEIANAFYVQDPSGPIKGIKIVWTGSVSRGQIVTVIGEKQIDDTYKEAYIQAESVTVTSTGSAPNPTMITQQKWLGGGDFDAETPGVNCPFYGGTYNKGVLVKSSGTVTGVFADEKCYYINDGCNLDDTTHKDAQNDPILGVRVSWDLNGPGSQIMPPLVGWHVSVTGISSSHCISTDPLKIIRVLRPRNQEDIVINQGGTPMAENPAPGWAEDVVPVDSSSVGGPGPSSADSVDLATGAGENNPGPDIIANNPFGPDVAFTRSYRSTLAEVGYSSAGLSPGWVHNYDVRIEGATGSWSDLTLIYPNTAQEILRPELSGGNPTGNFIPLGPPYLVTGSASGTPGQWNWVQVTFPDETSWRFTAANPADPDTYLLTRISDVLGHYVSINRVSATDTRLASITDDSSNTLLSFAYSSGYLQTATDSVSGNQVIYAFGAEAGGTMLKSVSQINSPTSPLWNYTYVAINGHPYLTWVEAPDATGATGMRGHPINYDSGGKVSSLVDANGNQRSFVYNGDSTQVFVRNSSGALVEYWTQKIGPKKQDLGVIDANNNATSIEYTNDYRPWRFTNKDNQHTDLGCDSYGNVHTVTDPRGVVTTYSYDPSNPFRLTSVQVGSKTSTTFDYYASGLLWKVNTPKPGTSGTGERVTTTYSYTSLGNVSTVTAPAPTDTAGAVITTTFDYTSDLDYNISGVTEKLGQPLRVSVYEENNNLISRAHFRYDSRGRLEEVIDGIVVANPDLRHRTNYIYNDADQVTEVWYAPTGSDPDARVHAVYNYVSLGGATESMDVYDENGNLFRHVDATNGNESELLAQSGSVLPVSYAYDALYKVKQITDGRSHTTSFGYDAVGNPNTVSYPGGTGLSWRFDPNHNINRRTDGLGRVTDYTLDSVDSRLTDVDYPSGTDPHFDYDSYGRVTQTADSTGTAGYAYDDNDLVMTVTTTYTGLSAKTVSYTYYPDGSRKSMTNPAGTFTYTYFYDATVPGRVVKVTAPWMTGSTQDQCIYNLNGQIVLQKTPRVQIAYTYNARGFMASLSNNPTGTGSPESYFTSMQYDAAGNLTQMSYNVPAAWSGKQLTGTLYYDYDEPNKQNRLIRERRVDSDPSYSYDVSFTPDDADNLTTVRDLSFSFNPNNQVTGYTYDSNGNVTSCRGYGFGYDYEDLPTSVTGGMYGDITMQYRADGLRAWKSGGSWFSYYLYDGDTVVCELNSSGGLSEAYLYGANGLIQRRGGTSAYYTYTFDPLGSHVQTCYYSGGTTQVQRFTVYDAFGKRWWDKTASGGNTNIPGPFGFSAQTGAYTDHETRQAQTDTPLVLMGGRYYDPITGRFVSRDQLDDDINDYTYCGNNPVLRMDPFGLDWLDNTSNFFAALGDNISFGLTGRVRQWIGADDVVDRSSGYYRAGTYTSYAYDVAVTVATCGASSAAHAGIDAAKAGKAVKVAATAGKASRRAVVLAANKVAGKAAGKAVERELRKQGFEIIGRQISVKTSQGLRRWEFLVRGTKGGNVIGIEVKTGKAIRTAGQIDKDIEIFRKGGVLVGKKARNAVKVLGSKKIKVPTMVIKH